MDLKSLDSSAGDPHGLQTAHMSVGEVHANTSPTHMAGGKCSRCNCQVFVEGLSGWCVCNHTANDHW